MKVTNLIKILYRTLFVAFFVTAYSASLVAQDEIPTAKEQEREEFELKVALKPLLVDVLKNQYVDLSINILYVKQQKPIIAKDAKFKKFKLPGFGSYVTISRKPDDISGFRNTYSRFRSLTLLINEPISANTEQTLTELLKEKTDLDLGKTDSFSVVVVPLALGAEEDKDELSAEKRKLREDRKKDLEKRGKLAKMFPELTFPPKKLDPRQEAESAKHLIGSRDAFFENNLTLALNEVIEALSINPYSPKNYEMLGSIYYRLKWNDQALSNWEKALVLNPENKKLTKYIAKVKNQL